MNNTNEYNSTTKDFLSKLNEYKSYKIKQKIFKYKNTLKIGL